jgi:hypothetical protein
MSKLSQISGSLYDGMFNLGPVANWPQKCILVDGALGFNVDSPGSRPKTRGHVTMRVLGRTGIEINYAPEDEVHGLCIGSTRFGTKPFSSIRLVDDKKGSIELCDDTGCIVEHGLGAVQEDIVFIALGIAVFERMSRDQATADINQLYNL